MVLRSIFGLKREEVAGGWRNLNNEEILNLYTSPDIVKMIKSTTMRWVGHVGRMGETKNAFSVLVRKPRGKRPLERPRRIWEYNIRMDLREIWWEVVD